MSVTPLEITYDSVGLLHMSYSIFIVQESWRQRLTDYS